MKRMRSRRARALAVPLVGLVGLVGLVALGAGMHSAHADTPFPRATDAVPDPGKGITNADDTSAIAVNPADLVFLPGPELRWNMVRTGDASPLPNRGNSFGIGAPLGPFATGLRLDLLDPSAATPAPFTSQSYRWLRWAVAYGIPQASIGTTLGWSFSDSPLLGGFFSLTSGLTVRPFPWLSASFVVRDWNEPESSGHLLVPRSYVWGVGVRPLGTRALEASVSATYIESSPTDHSRWGGIATLGIDVPGVGRLRGDLTAFPDSDRRFIATAGLDLNIDRFQVSGGGVFGDAVTRSGTGFFVGAAVRTFGEPGAPHLSHVARIRIDAVPGVRGNTHLLRRLWQLAADPDVMGVVLQLRADPAGSLAHAEEVRDAIAGLRAAHKKVLCHLEDAGGRSLFACSSADRIAMNPAGGLRFAGLSSSYFYFGGLAKKLGVNVDFVRIGAHKGAAEQFTFPAGSDVAHRDNQELIDELEQVYLHDIGEGRHIPVAELKQRIAKGPFLASEAKEAGLIDTLAYADEIDRVVNDMFGRPTRLVDDAPEKRAPMQWGSAPKVAVVYLDGDMIDGESQYIPILGMKLAGSNTIVRALKRASDDPSVKSIVFRIETGGGSSLAADVILRQAILAARTKPLIVSMGTAAASGGYYAAASGSPIFASRSTLTGSIGIFYGKADVSGLLDKLGVHVDQYRTSPHADAESLYRPFTDEEQRMLGVKVKQFYDLFVARVAEGRHMTPDAVDAIGRGKVWTGSQAIGKGLVDHLGGLREALAEARRRGGLPADAPIVEMPEEDDSLLGFLLHLVGISSAGVSPQVAAMIPPAFVDLARALSPFLVFDSSHPLARAELMEDVVAESGTDP